jgi:hypothetical protein
MMPPLERIEWVAQGNQGYFYDLKRKFTLVKVNLPDGRRFYYPNVPSKSINSIRRDKNIAAEAL